MATKKTPSKTSRATSKKKNINWLILCLIVVSFTSLGMSILSVLNTQKTTAKWLLEEEDLSLSILKNKDLMENTSEKIITMNERVMSLNNDIGDVDKRLQQIEDVVGKSMWSEEQELLAEIEQILKLANNGLIVTGNFWML